MTRAIFAVLAAACLFIGAARAAVDTPLERAITIAAINLNHAEHCGLGAAGHRYAFEHLQGFADQYAGRPVATDELKALHERFALAFNYAEENWTKWFDRDNCPNILHKTAHDFPGIPSAVPISN